MVLERLRQVLGSEHSGSLSTTSPSNAEFRHGQRVSAVLEHCILALISERPRYGFEIIQLLDECGLLIRGSVHPCLYRLENKGLLRGFFIAGETGRKRKYYQLTEDGARALERWDEEWEEFKGSVDKALRTHSPGER